MSNKKGFTLVELLAVIVILALIMSIAVVSIGGVLQSTRQSTFRESAASIIDGVRTQLLVNNSLSAGSYYFKEGILQKGGKEAPLGGEIVYASSAPDGSTAIGDMLYKAGSTAPTCGHNVSSFVTVTQDANNNLEYKICLSTTGTDNYIISNATETELLTNSNSSTWLKNN